MRAVGLRSIRLWWYDGGHFWKLSCLSHWFMKNLIWNQDVLWQFGGIFIIYNFYSICSISHLISDKATEARHWNPLKWLKYFSLIIICYYCEHNIYSSIENRIDMSWSEDVVYHEHEKVLYFSILYFKWKDFFFCLVHNLLNIDL